MTVDNIMVSYMWGGKPSSVLEEDLKWITHGYKHDRLFPSPDLLGKWVIEHRASQSGQLFSSLKICSR